MASLGGWEWIIIPVLGVIVLTVVVVAIVAFAVKSGRNKPKE